MVAVAAIAIAVFGVLSPIVLEKFIDESILPKDYDGLRFTPSWWLLLMGKWFVSFYSFTTLTGWDRQ